MGVVLKTILYDNVCQLLAASEWFSPCYTLVSTTNMIDLLPRCNWNIVESGTKYASI